MNRFTLNRNHYDNTVNDNNVDVDDEIDDVVALETIEIDLNDAYKAFCKGLKKNWRSYLELLRNKALIDNELSCEYDAVSNAFSNISFYCAQNYDKKTNRLLLYPEFHVFGLTADLLHRLGYVMVQLDSVSPKNSIGTSSSHNRRSVGSTGSIEERRESGGMLFKTHCSDDTYEDDFEIDDAAYVDDDDIEAEIEAELIKEEEEARTRTSSDNHYDDDTDSDDGDRNHYDTATAAAAINGIDNSSMSVMRPTRIDDEPPRYAYTSTNSRKNSRSNSSSANTAPVINAPSQLQQQHLQQQLLQRRPKSTGSNVVSGSSSSNANSKNVASQGYASNIPTRVMHQNRSHSSIPVISNNSATSIVNTHTNTNSSSSRSNHQQYHKPARRKSATSIAWINNGQWKLGEKIGKGSFGEVFQCMNNTGKLYAVKQLNIVRQGGNIDECEKLIQEIQLMKDYIHRNIVGYIGAKVDVELGLVYIFQEWVPGGSMGHLLKKFGPFNIDVIRSYTRQIMKGLEFLHMKGVIHRDIKAANVLIDEHGVVKLADFGASTSTVLGETQETTTIKGTPYFMAPEVLAHNKYGRKGDIWAVGCTMIQMLTGEPPWKDRNIKTLIQLHVLLSTWAEKTPPFNVDIPTDARHFLEMCFEKDEAKRPKASDLLQCSFLQYNCDSDDIDDDTDSHAYDDYGHECDDVLEDSGGMDILKEDMYRAVSRSQISMPKFDMNNDSTEEDDAADNDTTQQQHQQQQHENNGIHHPLRLSVPEEKSPVSVTDRNDDGSKKGTPPLASNPFARQQATKTTPTNPTTSSSTSSSSNLTPPTAAGSCSGSRNPFARPINQPQGSAIDKSPPRISSHGSSNAELAKDRLHALKRSMNKSPSVMRTTGATTTTTGVTTTTGTTAGAIAGVSSGNGGHCNSAISTDIDDDDGYDEPELVVIPSKASTPNIIHRKSSNIPTGASSSNSTTTTPVSNKSPSTRYKAVSTSSSKKGTPTSAVSTSASSIAKQSSSGIHTTTARSSSANTTPSRAANAEGKWRCRNTDCKHHLTEWNYVDDDACRFCATKKGATGRKDLTSIIYPHIV